MDEWTLELPAYMDQLKAKPPERLVGKVVRARLDEVHKKLLFEIDMPPDPTDQELAFFRWMTMEISAEAGVDLASLTMEEKK